MTLFGNRLKTLRQLRGWTQEGLGGRINVTKVSISGYKNGNRTPDIDTLQRIAEVFDVSIDYLLGRIHKSVSEAVSGEKTDTYLDDMEIEMLEELRKNPDTMLMIYNYKDLPSQERRNVLQLIMSYRRKSNKEATKKEATKKEAAKK